MTDDQANPQSIAADASAQALVANAGRLGLTWDLRPATVVTTDKSTGKVSVIIDADTETVPADSMIGPLAPGDRVFVVIIPPGGIFVTGWVLNGPSRLIARGVRSAAKTGIVGTELGALRVNIPLLGGYTYRISTNILIAQSTLNELARVDLRLRYAADGTDASTSSLVGVLDRIVTDAGTGNGYGNPFFYYFAVGDEQLSTLLTVIRTTGAGTFTLSDTLGAGPAMFVEQVGVTVPNIGGDV